MSRKNALQAGLRRCFGPRRGIDDSFIAIPLLPGGSGIGIPRWGWMMLVLLAGGLLLGSHEPEIGREPGRLFVGLWAIFCGLLDLLRRLRTVEYEFVHAGMTVVARASLLDRLTMNECGWYFPLLVIPIPLWALGTFFGFTYLDVVR